MCEGRLVALGGGGYGLWRTVPRAWAAVWAAISDQPLPVDVPPAWRDRWKDQSPELLPTQMHEEPGVFRPVERQLEISELNRRVAQEVAARALPA